MQEAKQRANRIKEPADVWKLERYLTQRRKDLDRKYEFRSSRLTRVFGRLLYERRIGEEDLRGLGEDKMKAIRSCARFGPTRGLIRNVEPQTIAILCQNLFGGTSKILDMPL